MSKTDRQTTLKRISPWLSITQGEMSVRASCWSLTINNPTPADSKPDMPAGWILEGQPEVGKEGTPHLQLMLKTPQVRFSAIKKIFPRAHIQVCRDKKALSEYVHKEATRVGERIYVESAFVTTYEYVPIIADMYDEEECKAHIARRMELTEWKESYGEAFVKYIDTLVAKDIAAGRKGAEFVGVNPQWRSAWKLYGREIISRHNIQNGEVAQGSDFGFGKANEAESKAE